MSLQSPGGLETSPQSASRHLSGRGDDLQEAEDRHHHRGQDPHHQAQAGRGEEGAVGQPEAGGDEVDQDGYDLAQGDNDEPRLCGRSQKSGNFPVVVLVPGPGPGVRDVFQTRGMNTICLRRNTNLYKLWKKIFTF